MSASVLTLLEVQPHPADEAVGGGGAGGGPPVDIVEQLATMSSVAVAVEMEVPVRQVAQHASEAAAAAGVAVPVASTAATRVGASVTRIGKRSSAPVISAAPELLGGAGPEEEAIAHNPDEVQHFHMLGLTKGRGRAVNFNQGSTSVPMGSPNPKNPTYRKP